jgi:hypothetical protein
MDLPSCQPVGPDEADIRDARGRRILQECLAHRLGRIDDDPFAAPERQGETEASGTAAHVDEHIVRLHVGGDDV